MPRVRSYSIVELSDALKEAVEAGALTEDDRKAITDYMTAAVKQKDDPIWKLHWGDVVDCPVGDTEAALRRLYHHYLEYEVKYDGPRRLLFDCSAWD